MSFCFSDAANFQYQHVNVITRLRKNSDFSSPFCDQTKSANLVFCGYLKTIDPISKSTILCNINSQEFVERNLLILGHNIVEIRSSDKQDVIAPAEVERIVETDSRLKSLNHPFFSQENKISGLSEDELNQRKEEISNWLSKLRIPNTFDAANNDIIIADTVKVKPPYESASDYVCTTRIVLNRVKRIIDSRDPNLSHLKAQD